MQSRGSMIPARITSIDKVRAHGFYKRQCTLKKPLSRTLSPFIRVQGQELQMGV